MKKIKNLWMENRVLFMLFLIVVICFFVMLVVCIKCFFGSSNSSYGDRLDDIKKVEITNSIKNEFIDKMKEDELVNDVTLKIQGKIVYINLKFSDKVTLVEAESKALASLMTFEQKYLDYYDFHYTLKSDKTESNEGFLIMGAKNVNGTGLVWNNNTKVVEE